MTDEITNTEEYKKEYLYAIRILAKRDYSEYKLRQKLRDRKNPQILIDKLVEELLEKRYLREENYTEARIKGFMHKGYSPEHIRQKLAQEFVIADTHQIEEIYQDHHLTQNDQILILVQKKCRRYDNEVIQDFNFKKKLIRYLMSKGHNYNDSLKVIDNYIRSRNG